MNFFSIKEFCIIEDDIPIAVADAILDIILILNPIRTDLGYPIRVSDKSGYRPMHYELMRGRNGTSQHTFQGRGAVDLTCDEKHFPTLVALLQASIFSRVCVYPNSLFIHCDFKVSSHKLYKCEDDLTWKRI